MNSLPLEAKIAFETLESAIISTPDTDKWAKILAEAEEAYRCENYMQVIDLLNKGKNQ